MLSSSCTVFSRPLQDQLISVTVSEANGSVFHPGPKRNIFRPRNKPNFDVPVSGVFDIKSKKLGNFVVA